MCVVWGGRGGVFRHHRLLLWGVFVFEFRRALDSPTRVRISPGLPFLSFWFGFWGFLIIGCLLLWDFFGGASWMGWLCPVGGHKGFSGVIIATAYSGFLWFTCQCYF